MFCFVSSKNIIFPKIAYRLLDTSFSIFCLLSATISTIDPDNVINNTRQSFVYRLVSNGDLPFQIQGHNLSTKRMLNYENKSSWHITVQSEDNGNPTLSINRNFTISVQG